MDMSDQLKDYWVQSGQKNYWVQYLQEQGSEKLIMTSVSYRIIVFKTSR